MSQKPEPTILFINHETAIAGGPTVQITEFVRAARAQGANLILYPEFLNGDKRNNLLQRAKQWFYHWFPELSHLIMMVKHAPGHAQILMRIRPDVLLILYTVHFSAILLARAFGIPIVLEVNCPYYLHAQYANIDFHLKAFWQWQERKALEWASEVVVISSLLREYYVALGFSPDKFTVAPNGVDLSKFDPVSTHGDVVRQRHQLGDRIIIGFVGRLEAWAGIDWFLEALPGLGHFLDNVVVLIIGSGPLEARVRQIVASEGLEEHVRPLGHIPHEEIPQYIASFDIAVAPYRRVQLFYGSPMKLYEYLAMGKPIITPRMGQSMELIRHQENGLLYEPDDAHEMIELLKLLIRDADLRNRLGRAAWISAREMDWTWERYAAMVLDVCRAAASKRRSI